MRWFFAIASAALLSIGAASAQPGPPPAFIPAMYAPSAADFSPRQHLSNLIGKTSATVCIVGDSTSTQGPSSGNGIDPSQMVWGMLLEHLKDQNPQITTWNYNTNNFGIGGTNWNQLSFTGTQMIAAGFALPAWWTDATKTWLFYPQQQNCDELFIMEGTNAPQAGSPQSSFSQEVSSFVKTVMETIEAWTYRPNPILVTNKDVNPQYFSDFGSLQAMTAYLRTFARSNGNGFTGFPNLQAKGFGLIDLGRYFDTRVTGIDPASQYLQSNAAYVRGNQPMGFWNDGVATTTVAQTTNGDLRIEGTFVGAGGVTLFNYGGSNLLKFSMSNYAQNILRFNVGSNGQLRPIYSHDGSISSPSAVLGTTIGPWTLNSDVNFIISARGPRVQVWLTADGVCTTDPVLTAYCKAFDAQVPRLVSGFPIQFGFDTAPTGSPLLKITNFYDGIATPTTKILSQAQAYGNYAGSPTACNLLPPSGGTTPTGCQGGNSANHQRSSSAAIDREFIEALDFHVPAVATTALAGLVKPDGTTLAVAADGTLSGNAVHPGFVASDWYPIGYGTTAGTPALPGAATAYCSPFSLSQKLTIGALAATVTTADAAGHFQVAVYNNGSWFRPSTLVAATGDIVASPPAPLSGAASVQLVPGISYWGCINTDSASVKFLSLSATTVSQQRNFLLGSATIANALGASANITGISVAQTYGTWPTWASNTAWADVITATMARLGLQITSVP